MTSKITCLSFFFFKEYLFVYVSEYNRYTERGEGGKEGERERERGEERENLLNLFLFSG